MQESGSGDERFDTYSFVLCSVYIMWRSFLEHFVSNACMYDIADMATDLTYSGATFA